MNIPPDLKTAILTLSKENIGDFTYTIRDRELQGWEGPRVRAWSDASVTIDKYAAILRTETPPPRANAFKA